MRIGMVAKVGGLTDNYPPHADICQQKLSQAVITTICHPDPVLVSFHAGRYGLKAYNTGSQYTRQRLGRV